MNIAVFCGSSVPRTEAYMQAAAELGCRLAKAGHTLVYGGSNLGMMGAVSGAAMQAGGRVVGVIPTLFSEAIIASQPVSQLVRTRTMAERKEHILRLADGFVALPGGIGTLDEATEVLVANQLRQMAAADGTPRPDLVKPMVLLNLGGYFDPTIRQLEAMQDEGLMRPGSHMGLHVATTVDEALDLLAAGCEERQ